MEHQGSRLIFFLFFLALFVLLEFIIPWRKRVSGRLLRWPENLSITVLNTLILRYSVAIVPLIAARYVEMHEMGLLNILGLSENAAVHIALSYILLDLVIYFQHRVFHRVPLLWRFHRVHHSDVDLDVTSGFRFHPVEIILSILIKAAAIIAIGPAMVGVVLFEVILNAGSMFNHSNIRVPKKLEGVLCMLVVTPRMHLVHHSTTKETMNKNYGFVISIWDRIFSTYLDYEKLLP